MKEEWELMRDHYNFLDSELLAAKQKIEATVNALRKLRAEHDPSDITVDMLKEAYMEEKEELTDLDRVINIMKVYSAFGTLREKKKEVLQSIMKRINVSKYQAVMLYRLGLYLESNHPHLYVSKW